MNTMAQQLKINLSGFFSPVKINYVAGKNIPALDGLRGIAVFSVMLYHCFPVMATKLGWTGVDLFFVLSGFLITGILLDTRQSPNYYKNFIVRRILRIFPLYYFVLILVLLLIPFLFNGFLGPGFTYYLNHQRWFWLYSQNWLYSRDGFPDNKILVHLWSLAVEEQFYIFWPWVIKFLPGKKLLWACISLACFSILFRMQIGSDLFHGVTYSYVATLSRMDALLIGSIIAILIREMPDILEKAVPIVAFITVPIIILGVVIQKSANFFLLPSVYTFIDLFFGCLLVYSLSAGKRGMMARIATNKILIFLGKYSYGLYVYHYVIYILLERKLQPHLASFTGGTFPAIILTGISAITLSLMISILSYRYLEHPFLKLKKFFENQSVAIA